MNRVTLIPVGGLANRMKAIDAAIALTKDIHAQLRIIWYKDWGLNCRYNQLFQSFNLPDVEVKEASINDLIFYDRPRRKNFYVPQIFQRFIFDDCLYENEVTQLLYSKFNFNEWAKKRNVYIASCVYFYPLMDRKLFSNFCPIPNLQKKIDDACSSFTDSTIGIHIRRTDNATSIAESPTELFIHKIEQEIKKNKDASFYLATDSEEDKNKILNLFNHHVITSPRKANRNSIEGMQDALVELYTLSHTQKIIGSIQSSYSETAAQISNIQCELLKKKS
ncbi:MAG: glycosyl transferase [Bacteroides sp.]